MIPVQKLAKQKLVTAAPQTPVSEAARLMAERAVGALLVVEGGALVGLFSERDAVTRVLAEGRDPNETRVADVCTTDLRTVGEGASVRECAELIRRHGVRHVPVVATGGRPVGIISSRDFLRYVVDELEALIGKADFDLRREELTDPYELIGA